MDDLGLWPKLSEALALRTLSVSLAVLGLLVLGHAMVRLWMAAFPPRRQARRAPRAQPLPHEQTHRTRRPPSA